MKVAGYVRVSTDKQAEEGLSLEEQQRRIAAYAESQGWDLVEMYIEPGVSGRKDSRPQLDSLLDRTIAGDFGAIIVPKLDRFGRRARALLDMYDDIERAGGRIVILSPTMDTSTASGKLLRTILAGVAEYESDQTGERVAAVQGARARQGRYTGSHPPYGWRKKDGALRQDRAEAAIVRRIFREWADEGRSQKEIARRLERDGITTKRGAKWTQARVRQVLKNVVHIGRIIHHGQVMDGEHEGIIAMDLWNRAQARLMPGNGTGRGRSPRGRHLFTRGLLRCAHCGYAMAPRTDTAGRESYVCLGRRAHGKDFCPMTSVPRVQVDEAAFAYFEHVALDVETAQRELEIQLQARRSEARLLLEDAKKDVGDWEARKDRIDLDYLDKKIDADEWKRLSSSTAEKLDNARRRVGVVTERLMELHPDDDVAARARDQVIQQVAELRATVAGQITSASGLAQVRSQLVQLFERFDIGRTDLDPDPEMPTEMIEARRQALQEARSEPLAAGDWVILPWSKPGVAEPLGGSWRPPLSLDTEHPSQSGRNTRSGSSTGIFHWPPFWARGGDRRKK